MNLTEGQYLQLTQEFGLTPERVNQIAFCNEEDLDLIIEAERLAGTITTVSGWERFLYILGEAKVVAEDLAPIFQIAALAAGLVPLL